jgi:hypothetical protein
LPIKCGIISRRKYQQLVYRFKFWLRSSPRSLALVSISEGPVHGSLHLGIVAGGRLPSTFTATPPGGKAQSPFRALSNVARGGSTQKIIASAPRAPVKPLPAFFHPHSSASLIGLTHRPPTVNAWPTSPVGRDPLLGPAPLQYSELPRPTEHAISTHYFLERSRTRSLRKSIDITLPP